MCLTYSVFVVSDCAFSPEMAKSCFVAAQSVEFKLVTFKTEHFVSQFADQVFYRLLFYLHYGLLDLFSHIQLYDTTH